MNASDIVLSFPETGVLCLSLITQVLNFDSESYRKVFLYLRKKALFMTQK